MQHNNSNTVTRIVSTMSITVGILESVVCLAASVIFGLILLIVFAHQGPNKVPNMLLAVLPFMFWPVCGLAAIYTGIALRSGTKSWIAGAIVFATAFLSQCAVEFFMLTVGRAGNPPELISALLFAEKLAGVVLILGFAMAYFNQPQPKSLPAKCSKPKRELNVVEA